MLSTSVYCIYTNSRKARKNSFVFGAFYAISQSIIFFAYAATFSYGGVLIEKGEMKFHNVFRYMYYRVYS